MNKKIIIALIAVIVVAGIGGYLYFSKTAGVPLPNIVEDIKETLTGKPSTDDWLTYKNTARGFSIKYPPNYEAKEESEGAFFVPPEMKDTTEQPKTLKELPLGIIAPPDKSYDEIGEEIKKQREGLGYSEETAKVIAGIQGIELRQGSKPESETSMHQLFNVIPYKNSTLIFLTFALTREQLEEQGAPLLDAFISTFRPESP